MSYRDWLELYINSWPEWKRQAGFVTTKTVNKIVSKEKSEKVKEMKNE